MKDSGLLEYVSAVRSGGEHQRLYSVRFLLLRRDTITSLYSGLLMMKGPVSLIPIQEIPCLQTCKCAGIPAVKNPELLFSGPQLLTEQGILVIIKAKLT